MPPSSLLFSLVPAAFAPAALAPPRLEEILDSFPRSVAGRSRRSPLPMEDDEEGEALDFMCPRCGGIGFADGSDGFFYCVHCGTQADDIVDTGVADEDFVDKGGGDDHDGRGALYLASHRRRRHHLPAAKPEPYHSQPQMWDQLTLTPQLKTPKKEEGVDHDGIGPTEPEDFGNPGSARRRAIGYEDYYNEVRIRYVMGLQTMVQLQCEALVREFGATPLICGIAGPIWLRFVAGTRVFSDEWADETFHESEMQTQGEPKDFRPRAKFRAEPHNMHGKRAVMIWYRTLRKKIPLSCSLAICFLACHVAREPILPTDIIKWSVEGKLPYFAAFRDIEKSIGPPSAACPLSSNLMFRPSQEVPSQKLEAMAASIALSIGLDVPPVNFYAICCRYLNQLCLPAEKIFPHACRLQEWSMPPDLWLSANELRLPTRVCVMSILMVAIRILYNIHGFGAWEKSLTDHQDMSSTSSDQVGSENTGGSRMREDVENGSGFYSGAGDDLDTRLEAEASDGDKSDFDAKELLRNLNARDNDFHDSYEYCKDLPTYLQYCKDVVFAGIEPSLEDFEEERAIDRLWDFYQKHKDGEQTERLGLHFDGAFNQKRARDNVNGCSKNSFIGNKRLNSGTPDANGSLLDSTDDDASSQGSLADDNMKPSNRPSSESYQDRAIRQLKLDMEENRFFYIPPRVKVKRLDYLHYVRKRDHGALAYVAHADYYILLHACARVAQVEIRCMHMGVMNFERRLAWMENRIEHCLHLTPPKLSCEFCSDETQEDDADDVINLSSLNI
ncbi:TATA box-binding protein-associated factor RNA polymerase I subunit B [Syzygium oleosum]|uniref:TATA box-binding protein-associated factor RNA polymerase I subunit B n=1 Tax=Syzygium oleosum TaxID=219896 RepID=UPI0011D2C0DE|nr:TATA box-binding protein-associated factor RNA polymerase I subunit B [Syzygium oleosum]